MKYGSLLLVIAIAGCTTVEVRPIPASVNLDKICIKFNDEVNVDDFVPVMQEGFADHGVKSVVFKTDKPTDCKFTASYTVDRWWDLAPYMADAHIIVSNDGEFLGSGHYHLVNHGGLSLAKWAGTQSKINPVMDQMLRNYPKVSDSSATLASK